jgi:hypothetical protein
MSVECSILGLRVLDVRVFFCTVDEDFVSLVIVLTGGLALPAFGLFGFGGVGGRFCLAITLSFGRLTMGVQNQDGNQLGHWFGGGAS